MKHLSFATCLIVFLLMSTFVYSDTIILKNGRQLEGKIVEETETSIKIDIGFGAVGFEKDKVEKIERSSEGDLEKLEERLEEKRQDSIKQAQENDQWYQQQERREDLIEQRTGGGSPEERKDQIRQKREEIIRKRKEQLQRLRERRQNAEQNTAPTTGSDSIPQPPPLPEPAAEAPAPSSDTGNVSAPQPQELAPDTSEADEEETSSRSGRRIHRLGEKSRR